jgi:uncharacterized protein YuzB (UPF0349 family)
MKYFLLVVFLSFPLSILNAQNIGTTIYAPAGCSEVQCPKIFGEQIVPQEVNSQNNNSSTSIQNNQTGNSDDNNLNNIVSNPIINLGNKNTDNGSTTDNSLFSNLKQKLKVDLHGYGKSCKSGITKAVPWTLVDGGVSIDSKEELLIVLDTALKSDYRIRRVTIRENILQIDYLVPSRIFNFIPVNYLFKLNIDSNTQNIEVKDPRWLSFSYNNQNRLKDTISLNIKPFLNEKNIEYVRSRDLYYKHSFMTAVVSSIMTDVDLYPYHSNFWICVIVPFFLLFLIILGVIFGVLLYLFTKRKKQKYIQRLKYGVSKRPVISEKDDQPFKEDNTSKVNSEKDDDGESLEDYIQSKRFK